MKKLFSLCFLVALMCFAYAIPPPDNVVKPLDQCFAPAVIPVFDLATIQNDVAVPQAASDVGMILYANLLVIKRIDSGLNQASQLTQIPEVTGTGEVYYANRLPSETNYLYASLSPGYAESPPDETTPETPEKSPFLEWGSWENIVGIIMLLLTTLFGSLFGKFKIKLVQAHDLIDEFITDIDDGAFSKEELARIKAKGLKLLGKAS